ncbi:ABC transporter permease (plasmid) [Halococcus dombrowskii]|nr:ABC transporter permease [Halococcus dombrowskii]UOO97541.1 ABC transporter permease [Halococcus dombrowskii]
MVERIANRLLAATVLERIGIAVASTASALIVGVFVAAVTGYDPVALGGQLFVGSFGSEGAILRTLRFTTIYILTGVAVAVAFRAGVFNIGVQGQFIVGGFACVATILVLAPAFPEGTLGGTALVVIGTLAAVVAGGLYAALPGVLKAYGGANEIITTIMLNFIATGAVGWLVQGPFRAADSSAPNTERLPETAVLPQILFDDPDFSIIGLILTLVIVVAVAVLVSRTIFGYDMVTSGHQTTAATYAGVDAKHMIVSTMTVSGFIAGFAGAIFAIMVQGYYTDPAGIGNYGFDAIAVSLLAANNPLGVIPAGLLFGGLESAGSYIQISSEVPIQLIDGIIGLVVLFVAVPELFRMAAKHTRLGGENR